ncbi:MAG: glycoside hydrolase family 140 protein [Candidatus Marinimicrobia bacterium]|nr:glycoside hydrolase family 140 protein [Candidatus Neomarinimicrobiota bacterium]MCF7830269.1 glycoside hydrolase family 140 protein [Candidatus Neomarinimicrobiota bacterium]MCF7882178.1 glycoside hydrolase family 140 protein [Candidatus Neomarinimicrobiota bacterium]
MKRSILVLFTLPVLLNACVNSDPGSEISRIQISENGRFFIQEDGEPFFWLGDTGWLLFKKLDRDEIIRYLDNRQENGFNVIQVMVLHSVSDAINAYGDSALIDNNVARPRVTEGNDPDDPAEYDYWDHVDFVVKEAARRDIHVGMVLVWGSNVRAGHVAKDEARDYARFLANRYKDNPNIIWLNGGDTRGDENTEIWNIIGKTLHDHDPNHLVTFHPYGRTQSSMWFHDSTWLDFNMFQSGHRRYDQDDTALGYGEDSWRYVRTDYRKRPVKPTVDGEPSYEGIPEGLHNTTQPYWDAADARRYAHWGVFAGAAGHTYGHSAVMQMYMPSDEEPAYGAREYWCEAIDDTGAAQMQHLKNLMLSRPYPERVPDQSLVAGQNGEKYDYVIATRGKDYAFLYTYTGRNFTVNMGKIAGDRVKASWYDPRNGEISELGEYENAGEQEFNPPEEKQPGNDWVLVLDSI